MVPICFSLGYKNQYINRAYRNKLISLSFREFWASNETISVWVLTEFPYILHFDYKIPITKPVSYDRINKTWN